MSSLDWVDASVSVISSEKIGAFKISNYSILKDGNQGSIQFEIVVKL